MLMPSLGINQLKKLDKSYILARWHSTGNGAVLQPSGPRWPTTVYLPCPIYIGNDMLYYDIMDSRMAAVAPKPPTQHSTALALLQSGSNGSNRRIRGSRIATFLLLQAIAWKNRGVALCTSSTACLPASRISATSDLTAENVLPFGVFSRPITNFSSTLVPGITQKHLWHLSVNDGLTTNEYTRQTGAP